MHDLHSRRGGTSQPHVAMHCRVQLISYCLSVDSLSVIRVYCDKASEARITRFLLNVTRSLAVLFVEFHDKIRRGILSVGQHYGWFNLRPNTHSLTVRTF